MQTEIAFRRKRMAAGSICKLIHSNPCSQQHHRRRRRRKMRCNHDYFLLACEQSCTNVHGISLRRVSNVTRVTRVTQLTSVKVLISATSVPLT